MDRSRLELEPGLTLDARRAVWLEETRTLVVADLHAGYVWAHRHEGNLLPLSVRDDTAERLLALLADYAPRELVLLGDIVHRASPVAELRREIGALFAALRERVTVVAVAGNHDRDLERLIDLPLVREHQAGPHLLLHGDRAAAAPALARAIIGHEHPVIALSDRVAHTVRCPCFLSAPELLVLPAFSSWAAGSEVRSGRFLSPLAQGAHFERVVAILAGKLLPLSL